MKIEEIIKKSCDLYNVQLHDLQSKSRKKNLVYARLLVCIAVYEKYDLNAFIESMNIINRDRTMAYHYLEVYNTQLKHCSDFKSKIQTINGPNN